jgi:poly-gamma-glutamate synthesis protein (capsule biosynthesis protein)
MERYKGKYIFYSLGNFIFDQYFSADTQEGLAVGLDYNGEKMEFSLFPYQSENSRIVWLDLEDKAVFLEKFAGWSDGDEELKENVVPGKFL